MPDAEESIFKNEIVNGQNVRTIQCKFCNSTVLKPTSAMYSNFEVSYIFLKQNKYFNAIFYTLCSE